MRYDRNLETIKKSIGKDYELITESINVYSDVILIECLKCGNIIKSYYKYLIKGQFKCDNCDCNELYDNKIAIIKDRLNMTNNTLLIRTDIGEQFFLDIMCSKGHAYVRTVDELLNEKWFKNLCGECK